MSGYTVTISPSGNGSGARTIIQVDTANGAARVTEMTVRAGNGGMSTDELPVIDFALLVAALTPGATVAPVVPAPAVGVVPGAAGGRAGGARPARARRARQAAEPVQRATRGRRRAAAASETPKAGRAYRRMPDQDEVVAAWNETTSASALAAHFDVPRHTAQGWLRRLRAMGLIENAS